MFDSFFHSGLINIFFPVSPVIYRFPSPSTSVSAVYVVSTSPEKDFQTDVGDMNFILVTDMTDADSMLLSPN